MNFTKIRKTVVAHVQTNSHAYTFAAGAAVASAAFLAYLRKEQMLSGTDAMRMLTKTDVIVTSLKEGTLVAMTHEFAKTILPEFPK